jgi:eukaryotic-like serine/threonine-protein kinase
MRRRTLAALFPALALLACSLGNAAAQDRTASPLDRLNADRIPAEDRKLLSLPGLVGLLHSQGRAIAALAFAPDGTRLAVSDWSNAVRLWQLGEREPRLWATLDGSPSGISFSPDGKRLAAGSPDTRVFIWDVTADKPRKQANLAGHEQRPFALQFSPDGKLLASGSHNPVLRLWKWDDGEPEAWAVLANEEAPSVGIASLAFSGDGKLLAAGSHVGRHTLRAWNAGGAYLEELTLPEAKARLVAFAPTEPLLAFSGDTPVIHLWDFRPSPPKEVRRLKGHVERGLPPTLKALAFSPTGRLLASAGRDRKVIVWDVASGEKAHAWDLLDEPRALAFAPDGRHLTVGNDDGSVYVLRLAAARMRE